MLTLFLVGILVWVQTVELNKQRLLALTKSVDIFIRQNQDLIDESHEEVELIRILTEPTVRELLLCYPEGFTAGFYSRTHDQVAFAVSPAREPDAGPIDARLTASDCARLSWETGLPSFSWYWSRVYKDWNLRCVYPVFFEGRVIGHTFARLTLNHLLGLSYNISAGLLALLIGTGLVLAAAVHRLVRRVRTNLQRLVLLEEHGDDRDFDFEEFDRVARFNRKTYSQLRAAERQKTRILESITDAFFTLDPLGRVTYINKEAERIFEVKKEELLNRVFWEIFPGERGSEFFEQCRSAEAHSAAVHFETHWGLVNRWVEVHVYPSGDGLSVYFQDISDRKRAERELAAERERLVVTLRSIGEGVIATDNGGRVVLMNIVAEALTGFTQDEAAGFPLSRIFYLADQQWPNFLSSMGSPDAVPDGSEVRHFNGATLIDRNFREIPVDVSLATITAPAGEQWGVVLVFHDISEKQKTELELLRAEKLESLGIMAGGIAHDFNNLLAAILANLQLAQAKLNKGNDISKYLRESIAVSRRASDLTKQLLTFSRGGAPVRKAASVADLTRETAGFVLRGSKIRLILDLPEDLRPAEIDTGQISQVIQNLIINAKQAMPDGGTVTITGANLAVDRNGRFAPGDYIRLTVQDNGPGIPRQHLGKIFDPFFTTKPDGTGLGLATSYSIIAKHHGYLEVESEEGAGAAFHIYLPASDAAPAPDPAREEVAAADGSRILYMEDEDAVRKVVAEMLEYFGYRVTTARDGREAVRLYRRAKEAGTPFAAVIMDLTVPGGSGGEAAINELRAFDPAIKALVCSGYYDDPILANYREYGFAGVITKPYKFDELNRELSRLIHQTQLRLDLES
jgi:PAS domain S-box-containing protein